MCLYYIGVEWFLNIVARGERGGGQGLEYLGATESQTFS